MTRMVSAVATERWMIFFESAAAISSEVLLGALALAHQTLTPQQHKDILLVWDAQVKRLRDNGPH